MGDPGGAQVGKRRALPLDFQGTWGQHPGRELLGALISGPNTSSSRMMLLHLAVFLQALGCNMCAFWPSLGHLRAIVGTCWSLKFTRHAPETPQKRTRDNETRINFNFQFQLQVHKTTGSQIFCNLGLGRRFLINRSICY